MMAATAAASSSNTRIPIKLSPGLFDNASSKANASYHTLHRDGLSPVQLSGATLRTLSGNNGSSTSSSSVSLNWLDGTKTSGKMTNTDEHDYVLLYDETSCVSSFCALSLLI